MRILLTGARAPVTLDLARHFHRAGHVVYLADSIRFPVARPTRAVQRTFLVAPPALAPGEFVDDLLNIVRERQIDLVIPTCEEIFFVAARLDAFAGLTRVFSDPLTRLASLHNKWKFVQQVVDLAGAAAAPETHLLECTEDLAPWMGDGAAIQWVFKPVYSRFAARTLISPTSAELVLTRPSAADPWVAQRRIRGQEYSSYSIAQAGSLRAHACYGSAHRAGRGSGIYFLPQDVPQIQEFVRQFAERLSYTGQLGFDFIVTDADEPFVLECNPRATSGIHLFVAQPLADAFVQAAGPLLAPSSNRPAMLASIMLMYALPESLYKGTIRAFCRDMLRARDVLFAADDPLPALASPLSLVEVIVTACRTRQPLTRASTFDIEWNGEPL